MRFPTVVRLGKKQQYKNVNRTMHAQNSSPTIYLLQISTVRRRNQWCEVGLTTLLVSKFEIFLQITRKT